MSYLEAYITLKKANIPDDVIESWDGNIIVKAVEIIQKQQAIQNDVIFSALDYQRLLEGEYTKKQGNKVVQDKNKAELAKNNAINIRRKLLGLGEEDKKQSHSIFGNATVITRDEYEQIQPFLRARFLCIYISIQFHLYLLCLSSDQ